MVIKSSYIKSLFAGKQIAPLPLPPHLKRHRVAFPCLQPVLLMRLASHGRVAADAALVGVHLQRCSTGSSRAFSPWMRSARPDLLRRERPHRHLQRFVDPAEAYPPPFAVGSSASQRISVRFPLVCGLA